jgi:hypothetical protein
MLLNPWAAQAKFRRLFLLMAQSDKTWDKPMQKHEIV